MDSHSKQNPVAGSPEIDVLVAGGGNAGLCAAMTAHRAGARKLLLESSPAAFRGGNSRHTRNLRYMHEGEDGFLTDSYPEEEFWDNLLHVTGRETNEELARLTIRESADLGRWMGERGVRWQPSLRGTLQLSRTNAFFLGGGKALINAYYKTVQKLGVEIMYDSEVRELRINDGAFQSAVVVRDGTSREVRAKTLVVASGGFEANIPWLKEYWGEDAENFIIRGTPYNQGRVLRELLDQGAKPVGKPREFHATTLDARAPKFDGGIATRLDSVPFGIIVDKYAKRFYDEGEDFLPRRYAIWGGLIARQPDQIAFSIVDAKSIDLFLPSVFPPLEAGTVRELVAELKLEPAALDKTVDEFNRSIRPGTFDPTSLDDCATNGVDPPKTHWARPIDTPPFYAYPLRPGITFTYLGVTVDERAQVTLKNGRSARNIFAAGESMAGNILGKGYLAGFGMTIGSVFGRIAGREATRNALA